MATGPERSGRFELILCLMAFGLSGASALTYEILWQREMYLVFGASAPATTAILTAIFVGIACGSWIAGRFLGVSRHPWLVYAALEAVMGGWGCAVPDLLGVADQAYILAVQFLGEGHPAQSLVRFALAILPLLPATLAMGATIPVMVRCLSTGSRSRVSLAYGINILGAVVGSLGTGLVCIRLLGMLSSRFVAVCLNAAAAGLALYLHRKERAVSLSECDSSQSSSDLGQHRALLAAYFAAGFVALGLEVVWLRFLGIVNTNSTVTFTLTLAIYLLGMGLGSLVLYPFVRRYLAADSVFRLANGGTAIASLMTFGVIYAAAEINQVNISNAARAGLLTLGTIYWTETQIIASLMFVPAVFMGLAYPAVCDSVEWQGRDKDRWHGRAYFWGTLGSVAGILLIGTLVIPVFGLHLALAGLIGLSATLCVVTRTQSSPRLRPWWLVSLVGMVFACAGYIAWESRPVLRETAAQWRDGQWVEVSLQSENQILSELARVKAGSSATVIVKKTPGKDEHLVYVDDQLVASTNLGARVDALMLAHLPLLLHPNPESALTVGFGTGGTSYAMTTHGVQTYCVEIEAEVPRAAYLMPNQNFGVLDNQRFHLILNDARDHLHAGSRHYDVIATDVTNLQYKQNGNLYTVEYFELMKEKLNPNGVACAWIPMAAIELRELQILMSGFQEVFPHASLWFMNHTHTNFGILIGTPEELAIDYQRLETGFADADVSENMALIGMTEPLQFVHCLHLDEDGYRQFCGDVPLHTDDLPLLEFSSPMSFYRYSETFAENLAATMRFRPTDYRRYVIKLPDTNQWDSQFARHAKASEAFCEVMLRMYQYFVQRDRRNPRMVTALLKQAIQIAEAGLEAWPEDRVREEFYIKFFSDAQQYLSRAQD